MFSNPMKYTPLKSLEELKDWSYQYKFRTDNSPCVYCSNNGQISYTDDQGTVWVTPARPEVRDILAGAGYKEGGLYVHFSNGEERPSEYQWLQKISDEECWAYTYQKAYECAEKKGIMPVSIKEKVYVREIVGYWYDEQLATEYYALATIYLLNQTDENVGTYIVLDEKTVVVCDEYGRTFLLRAKTVINDTVNALIDAGYTRTLHPEYYVRVRESH